MNTADLLAGVPADAVLGPSISNLARSENAYTASTLAPVLDPLLTALQELVRLEDIRLKYAVSRPDSPRNPHWEQYLVDVDRYTERRIAAWAAVRAAIAKEQGR